MLARADALQPWLQGPFWVGGDVVVGGAWRNDQRWVGFGQRVPASLRGSACSTSAPTPATTRSCSGAAARTYVLACEPFEFIEQARFLEAIYRSGVDFQPLEVGGPLPASHGTFDLVHCHGVLYHDLHPMALVQTARGDARARRDACSSAR